MDFGKTTTASNMDGAEFQVLASRQGRGVRIFLFVRTLYIHIVLDMCALESELFLICIEEIFVFKRFIFLFFSFPGVTMSGTQPFLQQTHPG